MNYLAHAFLSFENKDILLGNMISDFVKGKKQYDYPATIHDGIILHRMIDDFTDTHPVTHEAKMLFHKPYRLYSGAFMDVVYDHFLAIHTNEFAPDGLEAFSKKTYASLHKNEKWMPERFSHMFYYMEQQNWLAGYATHSGIHNSFEGLVRKAAYLTDSKPAIIIFEQHYELLSDYFRLFWTALKPFAFQQFKKLINPNDY